MRHRIATERALGRYGEPLAPILAVVGLVRRRSVGGLRGSSERVGSGGGLGRSGPIAASIASAQSAASGRALRSVFSNEFHERRAAFR